jgi:class 3 adenylate cyclase/tetratricopeptide (TPR) repeat protein
MSQRLQQISSAIAALEAQRAALGDGVVEIALEPLRRELIALRSGQAASRQQLRQVTVLFVDVVGSTAIGQQLEPEDIYAVMNSALERFTAVVQAHFGRVLQYTGDGMLAAFGADETKEDDVENAIRAGMAIIDDARSHAPEMQRRHGVPDFMVRAGLHTGTVLLGGGVDAEGSIRGATVNIAARMEQSAPPGRVRISHDTYRHVRGLFDVSEPAPIVVKGVDHPLRSYLVERAKPGAPRFASRGIEGVQTRMVGRELELEVICSAFAATAGERRSRALTVVGEAGVGKSRLLAEFQRTLNADACWLLVGRAHPRSSLHAYGVLREMLLWTLQIGQAEEGDAARRTLTTTLQPLFAADGEAPVHLIGHLMGLDFSGSPHLRDLAHDEARLKAKTFEACELYLRRLGDTKPVVVVIDDLHWADAETLGFARWLMSARNEAPLLTLFMTRPSLFDRVGEWIESGTNHRRLDLKPLDGQFSRELAESLLQRMSDVPPSLHAAITDGAEGNPFYMEELVKMLIDDGVIEAQGGNWRVSLDKLRIARVPATLTGVLQARLDALDSLERTALQQAAIVGHVLWDQALAAIDPAAVEAIPMLLRRQLLVLRESSQPDSGEYAFQHHLLYQVTYDSVLKESRRQGHERVGAFWSARAEVSGPSDVNAATCRALAEAHEHRRQADAKGFVRWFRQKFTPYYHAHATSTLKPLVHSVLDICERLYGPDHVETATALFDIARIGIHRRELDGVEPALQRALAIQERDLGSEHSDTASTLVALGAVSMSRGDFATAEALCRQALETYERKLGGEHRVTLETMANRAHLLSGLHRYDEAEAICRQVLETTERTAGSHAAETGSALSALADVLVQKGDFSGAEVLLRRAVSVQEPLLAADDIYLGLTLWHLAEALRSQARFDEAEPLARRALEIWERVLGAGHEWVGFGQTCLAKIRLNQGHPDDAVERARRACRIFERLFGQEHEEFRSASEVIERALVAGGHVAGAV